MELLTNFITVVYYILIAYIGFILVLNLLKAKTWEKEILYVIVLIPFLLRLFRLK